MTLLIAGPIVGGAVGNRLKQESSAVRSIVPTPFTVDQFLALTDDELARVDPAVINLVVARGVPQFRSLSVAQYVSTLDAWANEIRLDIERHRYRFTAHPEEYSHSEARYKIDWLVSDIATVFQVDYDVLDVDFRNPSNLFLNGIVDRKLGTCVSLPLLYVALGWRLGMPIKLVSVPTHLFARYDDGNERINIEATGYGDTLPDSDYEQRYFVTPQCRERGAYLSSLSPQQALAMMLLARASHWQATGDSQQFLEDSLRANLLFPEHPLAMTNLAHAWTARSQSDGYYDHAREALAEAANRINERSNSEGGNPIEKLIFDDRNQPIRVRVDRKTGEMFRVAD